MSLQYTRNFCIIAHIDHGKTTLSDRLLEFTGTIQMRDSQDQLLDAMDLERERGITIKAHPVAMRYKAKDGHNYKLNLLDTPGHVDFAYEVSRSLAACEGALVIVDAAQGVEAQTVANVHLANKQGLTIIPVINKIDLPNSDIPTVKKQLEEILAIPADEAILASAKAGIGIEEILEAVIARIPAPKKWDDDKVRGLVFDSTFDSYRGVVTYVRMMSGSLQAGDGVKMMSNNRPYDVKEVGVFIPKMQAMPELLPGDIGYVIANIKTSAEIKIGDTLTGTRFPATEALPGFQDDAADGVQRHLPDQHRGLRAPQGRHGQAPAQRFRRSFTRRKARSRSASVSGAGSSGCCTWRSSRSGSGASTTWTSSPRIPRSFTRWRKRTAKCCTSTIPSSCPTRASSRKSGSRL